MKLTKIYEIRDNIKIFYAKYPIQIGFLIKFLICLASMLVINDMVGYKSVVNNVAADLLVSIICMFLPVRLIAIVLSFVITYNLSGLSVYAALAMFAIYVVLYLVFFRFTPELGMILVITPVLARLNIAYCIPVIAGLMYSPVAIIPVVFGLLVYNVLNAVCLDSSWAVATEIDGIDLVTSMSVDVIKNSTFLLMAVCFSAVLIVTFVIRRLSVNYSHYIAIGSGVLLNILVMLIGAYAFDLSKTISVLWVIFGSIISIVIAVVADFFILTVDYARTERVQYEDDEYYYYVKAVPKIVIKEEADAVRKEVKKPEVKPEPERKPASKTEAIPLEGEEYKRLN